MEEVVSIFGSVTRLLAIIGGGVAAVCVAWVGIQFMTGAGDPQKMAQARMGLIGVVGGLILVGVAFIIPQVVSEAVIEPVGGVAIKQQDGYDCDAVLRRQLVFQNWASEPASMNRVITDIQNGRQECSSDLWTPRVRDPNPIGIVLYGSAFCFKSNTDASYRSALIGGQLVPAGLRDGGRIVPLVQGGFVRGRSGRDADNNILVYFDFDPAEDADRQGRSPSDGTKCWLYVSRTSTWSVGY